jgi:hypothetical protein
LRLIENQRRASGLLRRRWFAAHHNRLCQTRRPIIFDLKTVLAFKTFSLFLAWNNLAAN